MADLIQRIAELPLVSNWVSRFAPVLSAEWYAPTHDISMNLLEARRGRGKSFKLMAIGYQLMTRHRVRWLANFRVDRHLVAVRMCQDGIFASYHEARQFAEEHVIYSLEIDEYMTAFNSVITWDECNRSLNAYDRTKEAMPSVVHEWLQQCRKVDQTIWFATQYMDWIKPQVRMLFDKLWRAKVVRDKETRKPLRFNYYGSDPYALGFDKEISRTAEFRMRDPFDIGIARLYNTKEIIERVRMDTDYERFAEVLDVLVARGFNPRELPEHMRANAELYAALSISELVGDTPNAELARRIDADKPSVKAAPRTQTRQ